MRLVGFVLLFLVGLISSSVASPLVSVTSPYYELVDRLEAYRCAFSTLRSYRPFNGYDLLTAAAVDEERHPCGAPEWVLTERINSVRLPMRISLTHEFLLTEDAPTPLLGTDASVFALTPGTRGRPTVRGANLYNEIALSAETKWQGIDFTLGVQPGWMGAIPTEAGIFGSFYLQEAYLRMSLAGFELGYGRNELRFGHSPRSGLLLGESTAPLDRVWFGMRPKILPGFLDVIGPLSFETFFTQDRDGGKGHLWGVQLSLRPMRRWEIGVMEMFRLPHLRDFGAGDYLSLPFTLGAAAPPLGTRSALSMYVALWWFRHQLKTYLQWMGEGRPELAGGSSWLLGGYLVGVLGSELRVEAVFTGDQAYAGDGAAAPLTYRGTPLGSPIGPGGTGVYVDLIPPAFSPTLRTELGFAREQRNSGYDLNKPIEDRWSVSASLIKSWGAIRWKTQAYFGMVTDQKYEEHGPENLWAVLSKLYWELGG